MNYNELTNEGNVKWSEVASGGIRLDVDPLASLILAAIDAAEVKEGGVRVVERGSNANGDYVRFADGTQICWKDVDLTYSSSRFMSATWVFPAAFVASLSVVGALPTATARWEGGLSLNTVGAPFPVSSFGGTSTTIVGYYNNDAVFLPEHVIRGVVVFAIGRWK